MTTLCLFPNCGREIPAPLMACAQHWLRLLKQQRDRHEAAYEQFRAGWIGLDDLRAIQRQIMDEYNIR